MSATVRRASLTLTVLTWSFFALVASSPAADHGVFKTPSGNIICFWSGGKAASVECAIKSAIHPVPPRKACDIGDPVHSFIDLGRTGRATIPPCKGDPGPFGLEDQARVVPYGTVFAWAGGAMRCRSSTSGLRCSNHAHHGFTLSRKRARRF